MRRATREDKELIKDILVSAFASVTKENQINLVVKQDKHRIKRMHILMEYMFEEAISFGEVFVSDNEKACLLIKYPKQERITWNMIRISFKLAFRCIGITRVYKVLKRQSIAKKHYPQEEHIQPLILGAKEEVIGRGVGPRFMIEIKNHFRKNKLPAIIDTVSEENLDMYKRFGFKVINKVDTFSFPIYFLRFN